MEKIQINDQFKEDYKKLIQAAQNIESAIGSAYCKLNKMVEVRRQVDTDLKAWWDSITEEYKIDTSKDYYVDNDGAINVVEKPAEGDKTVKPLTDIDAAPAAPAEAVVKEEPKEEDLKKEAEEKEEEKKEDNKEGGTAEDLK